MGCVGGPAIVKPEDLTICLDKYDDNSYLGAPGTNLCNPDFGQWSVDSSGHGSSGVVVKRDDYSDGWWDAAGSGTAYTNHIVHVTDTSDNTRHYQWITGLSAGATYTFSNYYRKISNDAPTFRYQLSWYNSSSSLLSASFVTSLGISNISGWQRATCTVTSPANTDRMIWWLQDGADYTGYTHIFEIKRPQMEARGHVTRFVNGTRSLNDNWRDMSGNSNHVDMTSAGYGEPSLANTGVVDDFLFNGSSTYLTCDNGGMDIRQGSWTLCYWTKSSDTSGEDYVVSKQDSSGGVYDGFRFGHTEGKWRFRLSDGTNAVEYTASSSTHDGNWHHYAYVGNQSDTNVIVYVDGEVNDSSNSFNSIGGNDINPSQTCLIGGGYQGPTQNFDGEIAVIQWYDVTLTAAEVKANYLSAKSRFS